MAAIEMIALDHQVLASLPASYVASFIHAVAKMRVDDPKVWGSIAAFLAEIH